MQQVTCKYRKETTHLSIPEFIESMRSIADSPMTVLAAVHALEQNGKITIQTSTGPIEISYTFH